MPKVYFHPSVYGDDAQIDAGRYEAWYAARYAKALADNDRKKLGGEKHHAEALAKMRGITVAQVRGTAIRSTFTAHQQEG
jgi:hypothetical protein